MGFVNEVVSDEDIERYRLPFKKGGGRYWTRDADRDYYLWGGKKGNPAHGEDIEGHFHLYMQGSSFEIALQPGKGSRKYSDSPYVIAWESLVWINPAPGAEKFASLLTILKESLMVYGDDGRLNAFASPYIVRFDF